MKGVVRGWVTVVMAARERFRAINPVFDDAFLCGQNLNVSGI